MNNLDKFKHDGSEIAFVGDNWIVIKISESGEIGYSAANYFDGTPKGIGWNDVSKTEGLNYFNSYIKDGPIFIIFPKNNKEKEKIEIDLPDKRYYLHFSSNQFMDNKSRSVDLVSLLNNQMLELKEYFKPEFANGLVEKASNKLNVLYPNYVSGKFIMLYGLENLFDLIPENIKSISIENTSIEEIAFDIPSSIGKFKNLASLQLKNCIKSLPKEIGLLKTLKFLSVSKNPHLTELPKELAEITGLEFITIKGCDRHLKIPDVIVNRFHKEEPGMLRLKKDSNTIGTF